MTQLKHHAKTDWLIKHYLRLNLHVNLNFFKFGDEKGPLFINNSNRKAYISCEKNDGCKVDMYTHFDHVSKQATHSLSNCCK